jgi:copper resistance protein D
VAQFLDIFGFLSVLLRGLTLAFEALTVGGVIFLLLIARPIVDQRLVNAPLRLLTWSSILLAVTAICAVASNSAILIGSTDLRWISVAGAGFWRAGAMTVAGAAGAMIFARTARARIVCPIACALILSGSLMTSHSFARVEHRGILLALTLLHHLAAAAWIGGLPYLLLTLRRTSDAAASRTITSRFSRLAMGAVLFLVAAGAALTFFYVGSLAAVGETTYGIMLLAKVILTAVVLVLGSMNLKIVRANRRGADPELLPLRRFAEVEVGIAFTILLAAASLTSTPPAVDVIADHRVPAHEIAQRMRPQWPLMQTPFFNQLSPATPLWQPENSTLPGSFVPGQQVQPNTPADIAWSEYNHHWAGLVVAAIGILSLLSRRLAWARYWPLAFLGLALFLLIRADSENWPLGPRGFWESFQVAEVAQHRLFVLLIVAFAAFEWAVQTGRLAPQRAGLVFPLVCGVGGALLLTHSHSLGNGKEEFLAELSHIPLAILAVIAGWSRWLEIRLPVERARAVVGVWAGVWTWIWPVCFVLIGALLLHYRES